MYRDETENSVSDGEKAMRKMEGVGTGRASVRGPHVGKRLGHGCVRWWRRARLPGRGGGRERAEQALRSAAREAALAFRQGAQATWGPAPPAPGWAPHLRHPSAMPPAGATTSQGSSLPALELGLCLTHSEA